MKEFNITGVCIPEEHYMVNISKKLIKIDDLIEKKKYFTINRARQFGKTTTFFQIYKNLKDKYLTIKISFEGLGDESFQSVNEFADSFINLVTKQLKINNTSNELIDEWEKGKKQINKFEELSEKISNLVVLSGKEIILMIDEVDKSGNNQLFLHFLGMLRTKYLNAREGMDQTFKSVILAGVYDVKNLKIKLRSDEERKYNSPWNIAADFNVDMSFNPAEISTMLVDYEKDHQTGMNINDISEEIYKYTSGYPFLVSKLCKTIDEELEQDWTAEGVEQAVKKLLVEKNTLFDDLMKNLENNIDLYELINEVLVEGRQMPFIIHNPIIDLGSTFGILANNEGKIGVSNKVFEVLIYNYMLSKRSMEKGEVLTYHYRANFINAGKLNMELVVSKFQQMMKSEYREKDSKFIEREGRLLFLCFLKPIINGQGFYYVEPETRMDNRMDIVVTYAKEQFIVELKIWHGEGYEQEALEQLSSYLDSMGENKGYLVSFSFNKNKEYTAEWKQQEGKNIYAVVV